MQNHEKLLLDAALESAIKGEYRSIKYKRIIVILCITNVISATLCVLSLI